MEKDVAVRFDNVAGVDEAKDELKEVVAFLKDPGATADLGHAFQKAYCWWARRAPARHCSRLPWQGGGRAGLSISGSDFVEMFVGVGAARVRDGALRHGRQARSGDLRRRARHFLAKTHLPISRNASSAEGYRARDQLRSPGADHRRVRQGAGHLAQVSQPA